MKKFLSLSLALILCMALTVPALAANTETVNDLIITGFSRKETKTVKITAPDWDDGNGELVTKDRTITIYYLPVGATISSCHPDVVAPDSPIELALDHENYTPTADGFEAGGGWSDPRTITISADDDATWLNEVSTMFSPSIYYMVDTGSAPVQPAEPTTPAEPSQPAEPTAPAQPAQPTQPTTPDAAGTYTVKKGDTYGTIAVNNYGTYGVWKALYKANKGAKLTAGVTLTLPEKLGKVARINAPAAVSGETLYTVKAGDTLGAIAKATYGDVMKYKAIFERNTDRLKNANTIYEGQVIVLPAK